MHDTIEVTLPSSKQTVVLRNYTTVEDDEHAESVLYAGVVMSQKGEVGSEPNIDFPLSNVIASQKSYIPRLVISIDGSSEDITESLKRLRSDDYAYLRQEIDKIVANFSPKVKEA